MKVFLSVCMALLLNLTGSVQAAETLTPIGGKLLAPDFA